MATPELSDPLVDLVLDLCACAPSVDRRVVAEALAATPGVTTAHVDTYGTWAVVTFDPARTDPDQVVGQLAGQGIEAHVRMVDLDHPARPSHPSPFSTLETS